MNYYLTKDIKISTDSSGAMTAEHKHQGVLIEHTYYASRAECRRDAVEVLKERKVDEAYASYEAEERRLEREENAWRHE